MLEFRVINEKKYITDMLLLIYKSHQINGINLLILLFLIYSAYVYS